MSGKLTRRRLLGTVGAALGVENPGLTIDSGPRVAPVDEIVMVSEFEDNARLKLPSAVFSTIAGTDHQAFDRITVRSRMLIPTLEMDLSVELFGDKLFTPILIGAMPDQKRYHADAELGTVRGAAAARAAVVVSSRSSVPIEQLTAAAKTPLWYQVSAEPEAKAQIRRAVKAGVRAVVVTFGTAGPDWAFVDGLSQGLSVPLVVKGIMTPAAAKLALQHGAQGIIVPILALPSIVDAIAGKVPVLVDGNVRLGVDVFKALALGAQGVLVGRPAMWALGAYGADGVQIMVEILQTELAQTMSACSKPNVQSLDRHAVKLHATAMS